MGFAINTYSMHGMGSYADAARAFNNGDKLWRSGETTFDHESIRGLDGARNNHKAIVKHPDGRYAVRLYHTDVVTYYPDGRIGTCSGGYNTESTARVVYRCSPFNAFTCRGVYFVVQNTVGGEHKSWVAPSGGEELIFPAKDQAPLNALQMYRPVVDRVRAKELRAQFGEAVKLAQALCAASTVGVIYRMHREELAERGAQAEYHWHVIEHMLKAADSLWNRTDLDSIPFQKKWLEHGTRTFWQKLYDDAQCYLYKPLEMGTWHKQMSTRQYWMEGKIIE